MNTELSARKANLVLLGLGVAAVVGSFIIGSCTWLAISAVSRIFGGG